MKHELKVTTPTDTTLVMTREFDAPRRLVWEAMTQPELMKRWMFAPPGWVWTTCEMDVRVGGKFNWVWKGPDGAVAMTISGEHREVNPPSKIVHTELMEMGPGSGECGSGGPDTDPWELLATIELTEQAGRTRLVMTLLFPSKQARDGAAASGMEYGVAAGYDKLDGILAAAV